MGKSNRIRSIRATEKNRTLGVRNKKKGMPSWAMSLITVVVAAAILISVASILLSANGVFTRMTTVAHSDNYKINANVMAYYYNTQVLNLTSSYGTYISFDRTLPHDEQKLSDSELSSFTEGMTDEEKEGIVTWYDYFMYLAVESVESILRYCELADEMEITLDAEELDAIDEAIEQYELQAMEGNYPSLNSFLSDAFGPGVKESDVRKGMEYSSLATKVMQKIAEDIESGIDSDTVNERYDTSEDKNKYHVIDYSYYTFTVSYSDILEENDFDKDDMTDEQKATALEKYREAIKDAREKADALKAITDPEQFKDYIYRHIAGETFDTQYDTLSDDVVEGVSDETAAAIKAGMVNEVLTEIGKGETEGKDAYEIKDDTADEGLELYGQTGLTKAFVEKMNTVKEKVFSAVYSATTGNNVDDAGYIDGNKFSEWAFDVAREKNNVTVYYQYDGAKTGDDATIGEAGKIEVDEITKVDSEQASVTVYLLTDTQHKDTEKSRNFSYMVFESEDAAETAIEAIKSGELTKEAFLAKGDEYVEDKTATVSTSLSDYEKGTFGSAELDDWLFAEDTAVNTITDEPISVLGSSGSVYLVAFYEGEGEELWYLDVKNEIFTERSEAKDAEIAEQFKDTVIVDEKKLARVRVQA